MSRGLGAIFTRKHWQLYGDFIRFPWGMCTTVERAGIRRSFWPVWFQLLAIFSAFARYFGECFMFIYAFWLSSITELLFEIPLFKYSQARFIFSFECFMRIMGNPLVFKQNGKLCLPSNTVLYIVISTHFYVTLSWNKTPYNEVLDLGSALLTCENNFRVARCIHSCENKWPTVNKPRQNVKFLKGNILLLWANIIGYTFIPMMQRAVI